ncbi:hypothetical protein FD754_008035, partial [Muntiacus muntjak]
VASVLGTWLQVYPEDFLQSPEQLSMPDSDLEQRARHLLHPAAEEALETSPDLEPTAPLLPPTAPQSEKTQSPALIQVQGLHQINMPAPNPEPQRVYAVAPA